MNTNIEIGKGLTVNIDLSRFGFADELKPAALHIVKIGARNILMDSHASVKREAFKDDDDGSKAYRDASLAKAMTKLEALYNGDVRANAVTRTSSVDPVEAEARELARAFYLHKDTGIVRGFDAEKHANHAAAVAIVAKLRTALELGADSDDKSVVAAAIKARAAKPEELEKARANVAERQAAMATAVESVDLGL